jgi:hypothetical protein
MREMFYFVFLPVINPINREEWELELHLNKKRIPAPIRMPRN